MRTLATTDTFTEVTGDGLFIAEVGTGTVELQWVKSDATYGTIKTYSADEIEALPMRNGVVYRVVLTGTAVAKIAFPSGY